MGSLGEVVEFCSTFIGSEGEGRCGQVVGEDSSGEGCHEGCRRAETGLVSILKTDTQVGEFASGVWCRGCGLRGLRVVIVVGKDGDFGGLDVFCGKL